ncbi:hypothetical protein [Dechloromonas sp.]|uniref:hypothetical protein n=1 Tax=Dechloromonas sp. TaxID=1917218 RepID=UPI00286D6EE1|nr:hypothetical protein [Dechloromonas sp.]
MKMSAMNPPPLPFEHALHRKPPAPALENIHRPLTLDEFYATSNIWPDTVKVETSEKITRQTKAAKSSNLLATTAAPVKLPINLRLSFA